MSDEKITKTRKILQEKFGYTTNLPNNINRLHDDVTEKNGKGGDNPAYMPVEKYRKQIKLLMGATTTEEDGILEDVLDFRVLRRVLNKSGHDVELSEDLENLELGFEKNDKNLISSSWERIKDKVPFWVLGMLGQYRTPGDNASEDNEELPENDKEALVNLIDAMEQFNSEGEKFHKEATKNSPKQTTNTQAKKNLDKAKKDAGIK